MFKILKNAEEHNTHTHTVSVEMGFSFQSLCICLCALFFRTKVVACHTTVLLFFLVNILGSHLFILYQPWKLCLDLGCIYLF